MNNLQTKSVLSYILLLVLVWPPLQAAETPAMDVQQFVNLWLLDNCDTGKTVKPQDTLRGYGASAEELLLGALQNGPDAGLLGEQEKSLNQRWEKRQKYLQSDAVSALDKDNLELARKQTKEQYINSERDAFQIRFRERALAGLEHVGEARALEMLGKMAANPTNTLRGEAQRIVTAIKQRQAAVKKKP